MNAASLDVQRCNRGRTDGLQRREKAAPARACLAAIAAFVMLCCGLFPASAQQTSSFERLVTWTAVLSDDPEGVTPAFFFVAPLNGFRDRPIRERELYAKYIKSSHGAVTGNPLWEKHRDADIRLLTGLDFSAAEAFMMTGTRDRPGSSDQNEFFAIAIPGAEANAFRDAYEAREFLVEEVAGVPVFHRGGDNTVSASLPHNRADPFDALPGRSQRVALVRQSVLFAPTWAPMRSTVEAIGGKEGCSTCLPWRVMVGALEAAMEGAHLEQAWGWPALSTFRTRDLASLDPEATKLPSFTQAIFAITVSKGVFSPHLVVHFSDPETAEFAIAEITRRFSSGVRLSQRVEATTTHLAEETSGAVVILTIATGGSIEDAYGTVANWLGRGVFHPLAFE